MGYEKEWPELARDTQSCVSFNHVILRIDLQRISVKIIDINVLIRSGHFKVMCTSFTSNEMHPDGMAIRGLATGADTGRYESSHGGWAG